MGRFSFSIAVYTIIDNYSTALDLFKSCISCMSEGGVNGTNIELDTNFIIVVYFDLSCPVVSEDMIYRKFNRKQRQTTDAKGWQKLKLKI